MRFRYAVFYVSDIEKTVIFYENAFGVKRRFIHETGNYAELETEGVTLAFASCTLAKEILGIDVECVEGGQPSSRMEIAFVTSDVDEAYARAMQHGATALKTPKVQPWGQTVAYIRDINGFIVELATPGE
jgi:lactoylglutathione lyase